ncbi:MAG: hypothetical protein M1832_003200 [Thelocarpon impressellum]|nr:MAG: hypothetical protein M1832_003200 [Thelocarpon impressellum]
MASQSPLHPKGPTLATSLPKFSDFEPVGPNNASQPLEKLASSSSGPVLIPRQTIKYASEASINVPSIAADKFHGTSSNDPTTKYVQVQNAPLPKLSDDLLKVGVDGALSTQYGLDPDTGVLLVDETTKDLIADLKRKPHLSRDGGKGGYLNGQKLFIFCDTGSYTGDGDFLGFVSSSVAIDKGMNAANGQPLTLEDGIGQWGDDAGRMRGFSPLTSGEQSYNLVMQGQGQRYAVWPESSLLPLNQTAALLYAPIVYDNVDMKTKKAVFTYTGTTLLVVTAHEKGGPRAERVIDKLFKQEEVEWGTIGGLRSYGPSGVGGNDGRVYIFGNTPKGLLLARVDVANIAKRHSYEYWTGGAWSPGMQAPDSPAHFVKGAFMDGDIFYSPAHLTFIFVFLNPFADNTFYFSYLEADHAILPPSVPGADPNSDYAENLVKFGWSDPQVLYKATAGPTGMYIYAGGVHQGYFDDDDITNGGKKMLLSWTAPTGKNPASDPSEYSIMTAEVEFA